MTDPVAGDTRTRPKLVVGVDGSPASNRALRWAADQAARTGAVLHALTAWTYPAFYGWGPGMEGFDFGDEARRAQDAALKETLGEDVAERVIRHVVDGQAAAMLLEAAADAELLVVGSRGHGGFAGLLLGSVSSHVVAHARCPVVVVH